MHAVLLGGFGSNRRMLQPTKVSFEAHTGIEMDIIPFRAHMNDEGQVDTLRRQAHDALWISHSAGALALQRVYARPIAMISYAAPIPTSKRHLVKESLGITHEHLVGALTDRPGLRANHRRFLANAALEDTVFGIGNLRHLGAIAAYDSLATATAAREAGLPVIMNWTAQDRYFQPSTAQLNQAAQQGVIIDRDTNGTLMPGIHNELLVNPDYLFNAPGFQFAIQAIKANEASQL